jgi:hypothetical protein
LNTSVQPATVEKDYTSAFALDEAKLRRVLDILKQRFDGHKVQFNPTFTVYLSDNRRMELSSLEGLMKLDNAIRNPVESLAISASFSEEETELDAVIRFNDSERNNIRVRVVSSDRNLALPLFAELEEQVERTFLNNWIYRFFKGTSPFLLTFPALALATAAFGIFSLFMGPVDSSSSNGLPVKVANELVNLRGLIQWMRKSISCLN